MKKIVSFILKHKKKIIITCCVCIIGISLYSDYLINKSGEASNTGSYIYNADISELSADIPAQHSLLSDIF